MQGPLLVCTTCNAVGELYQLTPQQRRNDLVFASNGMHLRFFAQQEIDAENASQALLYLSGMISPLTVEMNVANHCKPLQQHLHTNFLTQVAAFLQSERALRGSTTFGEHCPT